MKVKEFKKLSKMIKVNDCDCIFFGIDNDITFFNNKKCLRLYVYEFDYNQIFAMYYDLEKLENGKYLSYISLCDPDFSKAFTYITSDFLNAFEKLISDDFKIERTFLDSDGSFRFFRCILKPIF